MSQVQKFQRLPNIGFSPWNMISEVRLPKTDLHFPFLPQIDGLDLSGSAHIDMINEILSTSDAENQAAEWKSLLEDLQEALEAFTESE